MPSEEYWIPRGDGHSARTPAEFLDRRRRARASGTSVYIRDVEQGAEADVLYAPTAMAPLLDSATQRKGRMRD